VARLRWIGSRRFRSVQSERHELQHDGRHRRSRSCQRHAIPSI